MLQIKKCLSLDSPELNSLVQILNNKHSQARLIGGCVRDKLLNIEPADIDIATTLLPSEVIKLLQEHGIQTIPTGIKYGTVTAVLNSKHFEITTLRKDVSCDGRWAKVEFSDSFEQDAQRRDFTINALSYCPINQIIFDYFSGLQDLENHKVIFIGNANMRIEEDYLRILRFFRFSSYYSDGFDELGLEACNKYATCLTTLSQERINSEVDKILLSPKVLPTLDKMQTALLNIFPNLLLDIASLQRALRMEKNFVALNIDFRYAIVLNGNAYIDWRKLKFSNKRKTIIQQTMDILKLHHEELILALKRNWIKNYYAPELTTIALVFGKITEKLASELMLKFKLNPPKFHITGHQIQTMGYNGKDISTTLDYLERIWIEKDCSISPQELLSYLPH